MTVASRLSVIRDRIASAARRSGRSPRDVALVAVSKFQPVSAIEEAYAAGQRLFGENRVQESEEKSRALAHLINSPDPLRLELIGVLQSNKVRKAVASVVRIQSIDSVDVGVRVGRVAAETGRTMPVLIQVDLASETTKAGIPAADLFGALESLRGAPGITVVGLMAIPPFFENAEDVRPFFARLRALRDDAAARGLLVGRELSMGLSNDFEVAIEEGATIVRIGTAIFGDRPPKQAEAAAS